MNAQGEQIEKMTATLAGLTKSRKGEVAKEAATLTASQGVPAKNVGGVSNTEASDAPKNSQEFKEAYAKISDPVEAGAYYDKYHGKY